MEDLACETTRERFIVRLGIKLRWESSKESICYFWAILTVQRHWEWKHIENTNLKQTKNSLKLPWVFLRPCLSKKRRTTTACLGTLKYQPPVGSWHVGHVASGLNCFDHIFIYKYAGMGTVAFCHEFVHTEQPLWLRRNDIVEIWTRDFSSSVAAQKATAMRQSDYALSREPRKVFRW